MIDRALKTLEYIVNCDYVTLFIFLLLGVLTALHSRKNKILVLFVLFSFGWRMFYNITSSRYCLIFVLYSFVLYSFVLYSKSFSSKQLLLFITFFFFFIDFCKCFSSYRNNYVFDVADYCKKITSDNPNYKLFISEKESYRIGRDYPRNAVEVLKQRTDFLDYVTDQYRFLFGGKYVIVGKERTNIQPVANKDWKIKKVSSNHTNASNTGFINIYSVDTQSVTGQGVEDTGGRNLIYNGDYEIIQTKESTLKSFRKWIESGADFYKEDNLLLPDYELILEIWYDIFQSNYPRVYSDRVNPISGKSSLHVILKDNTTVYLQNKIPAQPGTLSFNIKNVKERLCLKLNMIEYMNGTYNSSPFYYGIEIFDNDIHRISFQVNDNDFSGDTLLFRITGAHQEFLIDDVQYIVKE